MLFSDFLILIDHFIGDFSKRANLNKSLVKTFRLKKKETKTHEDSFN